MWVRGLKPINHVFIECNHTSHPMWVRGLKLALNQRNTKPLDVAPYVGAWIETVCVEVRMSHLRRSHPMWVRGLKLRVVVHGDRHPCRTLCGCVD